jgi:hypothetical protein
MMTTLLVFLAVFASRSRAGEAPWTEVARAVDVASLVGKPVTNSRWEQIARIERVLVEPEDGRAAFVVLSFLDRGEMLALPWDAVAIDARAGSPWTSDGIRSILCLPTTHGGKIPWTSSSSITGIG